jgi:hypothetical protein
MIAPEEEFLCAFGSCCIHLNNFSEIKRSKTFFLLLKKTLLLDLTMKKGPTKPTKSTQA